VPGSEGESSGVVETLRSVEPRMITGVTLKQKPLHLPLRLVGALLRLMRHDPRSNYEASGKRFG
jgi:hypothetical protein